MSTAARRPRNGRDPQDWRRRLAPPDGARDALCHPACAATPRLPSLRRCSPLTLLAADRDYLKSTQESFSTPPIEARSEAAPPACHHLARSDQACPPCHRSSSSAWLRPWAASGACWGSRAAWCPFGRRRPSQSRPWTRCFLALTSCTSTRGSSGNGGRGPRQHGAGMVSVLCRQPVWSGLR